MMPAGDLLYSHFTTYSIVNLPAPKIVGDFLLYSSLFHSVVDLGLI